jgi:hypothetical protein
MQPRGTHRPHTSNTPSVDFPSRTFFAAALLASRTSIPQGGCLGLGFPQAGFGEHAAVCVLEGVLEFFSPLTLALSCTFLTRLMSSECVHPGTIW